MNRKNTILLAVLMNAGLLVVLFVTALTSQEEVVASASQEMAIAPSSPEIPSPLFGDEIDLALRQPLHEAPIFSLREPQEVSAPVHVLPSLVADVPAENAVASKKVDTKALEVVVKKGDSLDKIAKLHHTTVGEISKLNYLPSSFLKVGQVLKIPSEKTVAKASVLDKKASGQGLDYYTVKVGDNPWSIAMKHHLKVDELLKLNALNEEKARKLKPGDRLRIR